VSVALFPGEPAGGQTGGVFRLEEETSEDGAGLAAQGEAPGPLDLSFSCLGSEAF